MLKKDRVYAVLKQRIQQGEYPVESKLPSETALAQELDVSRITLRTALAALADEGLLEINGHFGTRVARPAGGKRLIYVATAHNVDTLSIHEQYQVATLRAQLFRSGNGLEIMTCWQLAELTASQFNQLLTCQPPAGFILQGGDFSGLDQIIARYAQLPATTVTLRPLIQNGREVFPDRPCVSTDFRQVFGAGVKHLQFLGHTRIASIFNHGDYRGFTPASYRDFLQQQQLVSAVPLIREFTAPHEIRQQVRDLMTQPKPPTAFMCYCDATALQVNNELHHLGITIPQKVSVLGICGYSERLYMDPPLSIVNFHYDWQAREVVKLLFELENKKSRPETLKVEVPFEVVDKGSTARCCGSH